MTTVHAAGRYKRWERLLDDACWKEIDDVGMFVPKGHAVLHMLAAVLLWGAVDNARLNNFEHDHIMHVKDAVLRTRGHASTMHKELEPVVDRMDAVKGMHSIEWGRGRPAESQCARLEATAWAVEYSFVKMDVPKDRPIAQRVDMVAFFNVYNATAFSAFRKKFKTRRLKPPNEPQVRLGKTTRRCPKD